MSHDILAAKGIVVCRVGWWKIMGYYSSLFSSNSIIMMGIRLGTRSRDIEGSNPTHSSGSLSLLKEADVHAGDNLAGML